MMLPSRETVEQIRKSYPVGCRVELISMNDPYHKMASGIQGTVEAVDDIGTIFVNWDDGSSLGVAFGEDQCKRILPGNGKLHNDQEAE